MPSLTDELTSQTVGMVANKRVLDATVHFAGKGLKTSGKVLKGICLILGKGVGFTTENVMKAVNEKALKRTGDIKYSRRNVSIDELSKSGFVKKIDDAVTADVMKHFDAACKTTGVRYSAMKDEKDPQNPQYYIFYEGKTADVILHVLEAAYKEYMSEQDQKSKGKNVDRSKEKDGLRESTRAKLAFFRDRVADRDRESDAIEKHHAHSEPQR